MSERERETTTASGRRNNQEESEDRPNQQQEEHACTHDAPAAAAATAASVVAVVGVSVSESASKSASSSPQPDEDSETRRDKKEEEEEEGETGTATTWVAPRLHRDAIQSMFDFLDRHDFARLARTSKEFLQVAIRMASRRWEYACSREDQLDGILASPLRRHITTLKSDVDRREFRRLQWLAPSLAQLVLVAERLSHLEVFTCFLALESDMAPESLMWPAKLHHLNLHLSIESTHQPKEVIDQRMALIGESLHSQAPMVERFTIRCLDQHLPVYPTPGELLSPLVQWSSLKKLDLHGPMSPSACSVVRRMQHLTRIELIDTEAFVQLMSPDGPVPPRLEEIFVCTQLVVTPNIVPLLLKLPTLRILKARFALLDPTPLVPILRQLRSLQVERLWTCNLALFVSTLQQCTQLTDLDLVATKVESHLAAILLPMHHLQKLSVCLPSAKPSVKSLDFLHQAVHLTDQLKELRLHACHLDPSKLLAHLRPLRSLEKLVLLRCFTSPFNNLDPATIAARLTLGDVGFQREVWPHLRHFEWTP